MVWAPEDQDTLIVYGQKRLTGAGALTGGGASSSSLSLELLEELLELEDEAAALAALIAASVWIADGSCLLATICLSPRVELTTVPSRSCCTFSL